jgi:dTDP-4-amino-4,6-dideoxygalactose transaminase
MHTFGHPCRIEEIKEICDAWNIILVEDAAESLGSIYKGKATGTFGDIGILSFNGNKIITTSGGGMAISNNQEKIDKMRFWASQSRDKARHYQDRKSVV